MTQPFTTVRRSTRAARAWPRPLRWLGRALAWLYADRPMTSLGSPGYAGELPTQRYAELRVLRHQ